MIAKLSRDNRAQMIDFRLSPSYLPRTFTNARQNTLATTGGHRLTQKTTFLHEKRQKEIKSQLKPLRMINSENNFDTDLH